jgi:hypothetical protein
MQQNPHNPFMRGVGRELRHIASLLRVSSPRMDALVLFRQIILQSGDNSKTRGVPTVPKRKDDMKAHLGFITLLATLCSIALSQAADESTRSTAQAARAEAQQLLKDRDTAGAKVTAAEQILRAAGIAPESLGFATAKTERDQRAAAGSKATAYDRYAKTAKQIEKRIQEEISRGERHAAAADIARFERLQAEVDLARIAGRLPAQEETPGRELQ